MWDWNEGAGGTGRWSFAPTPPNPEGAFDALSVRWTVAAREADPNGSLPARIDDLALAALLIATEWGRTFSSGAAERTRSRLERVDQRTSIDRLSWDLCLAGMDERPQDHPAVGTLTHGLGHPNSSVRGWFLQLGWLARRWLDPDEVTPRLLKNLADTLLGPMTAGALAAAVIDDEQRFWVIAEGFGPPKGFVDQYQERLAALRDRGILASQAGFLGREVRCRVLFTEAMLGGLESPLSRDAAFLTPVTRSQARIIAQEYLSHPATPFHGQRVTHVEPVEDVSLRAYTDASLSDSWVAYLESARFGLQSSNVVLVSRTTGKVVYVGSAGDEG